MEKLDNTLFKYWWMQDTYLSKVSKTLHDKKILIIDQEALLLKMYADNEEFYLAVAENAKRRGLLRDDLSPNEFKNIRITAQASAAKNASGKTKDSSQLDNLYKMIPTKIGDLSGIQVLEKELEAEKYYVNPYIYSLIVFAHKMGIRIILVSKSDYSINYNEILLKNSGMDVSLLDTIYKIDSYEVDKLENLILQKYSTLDKNQLIFIRYIASSNPLEKNENVIDYSTALSSINSIYGWEKIHSGRTLVPQLQSLRMLFSNTNQAQNDFWFDFGGRVLGPILVVFCDWLLDLCQKEGRNEIYPLMREGSLLSLLLKEAARQRGINIVIKPLFVSRQATFLPSIKSLNRELIEGLFDRRHFTVGNLLNIFGLKQFKEQFLKFLKVPLSEAYDTKYINSESLKEVLITFLLSKEIRHLIERNAVEQREMFIKYLRQTCTSLENIVTVDLGFEGTIQNSIESILNYEGINSNIAHVLVYGGEKNKYHILNNIDIRGFAGNAGENIELIKPIIRSSEMIEQLLMGDLGSVKEYTKTPDEKIIPVLGTVSINSIEKASCQGGIQYFQQLWYYLKRIKPNIKDVLYSQKEDYSEILNRVIKMPLYKEAVNLGNLKYDENFGSEFVSTICTSKDIDLLNNKGIERFLNDCTVGYRRYFVNWPEGVITLSEPYYIFEYKLKHSSPLYLIQMIDIAKQIKSHNIDEIIIYGAGEAGKVLFEAAQLYNIKVICFVDRNNQLWGNMVQGTKIISLKETFLLEDPVFAIGSFSFVKQIKDEILVKYNDLGRNPKVFTIDD
ncbi:hypothetical protein ACQCT6_01635 [Cytobacillus gottheilii]|uniref:hypothetical protein n=1 Tax=Cytobacillus gottheilii TaxID=859144 RepID=UPI003CEB063F